ncbi:LytR/AlgR family response regulator transcription factor [Spirosoma linguale]|uniref:Two component transcriptional regulator, LytTR family n=1 Tax=Spirosoma linguale (strain ATCC 33905 / DSM 74 / LMG 10896 / Claus 1) TaxID=504472 RepID=D2QPM9_SPILD|nr:two component transcriptional regulator, LytTR family [Spirosoma linguale DSM 74]
MTILRCYIIDDEAPNRALIEKYIHRLPSLTLVGSQDNAVDALLELPQVQPDLIFLDVEMPEMTGFEFLRVLPSPRPTVIMVTAYPQYAVDGFEHDVIDYLVKPVSFERFFRAVNKILAKQASTPGSPDVPALPSLAAPSETPTGVSDKDSFFLVKEDKKLVRVELDQIVFIESLKDYLKIYLPGRTILTHMTLTRLEEMLPPDQFVRVNRSYIIRTGSIKEIDGNTILTTNGMKVPIGVTYREEVMKKIRGNIM